jgi:DNA-binding NtrC family response regulator
VTETAGKEQVILPKLLVVDDDPTIRSMFASFLSKKDYDAESASTLAEMNSQLQQHRFDALILDMILPDGNSLDMIETLRKDYPEMAIVMITADGDVSIAVEAMRRGADNFMSKPVSLNDLDVYLNKALELEELRRRQVAQQRQQRRRKPFSGSSPIWTKTQKLAELAASNDSVTLLTGETGTGKGVWARWIHENSPRRNQPFVEINCSSLGGDLLASELFGHVKGAFTSAVKDKQGLIEIASNGTLFLDEIGDMDIKVQAKFLKVIEEKRYRRVGDVKERSTEFRLLCATNHDLQQQCRDGEFREDLFFRINVFPIRVRPLRDMPDDIPLLVEYILGGLTADTVELADGVMDALVAYPWPGNVRELYNVLERALLLSQGDPVTLEDLPGLQEDTSTRRHVEAELNLEETERVKIEKALERFDGNTEKAAQALGISRATLYRRLKKFKEDV